MNWKDFLSCTKQFCLFRRSRESYSNWSTLLPVLLKKCNIFCQQIEVTIWSQPASLDCFNSNKNQCILYFLSILLKPVSKRKLQAGTHLALLTTFHQQISVWIEMISFRAVPQLAQTDKLPPCTGFLNHRNIWQGFKVTSYAVLESLN